MPRRKGVRQRRTSSTARNVQPFSLILAPAELKVLRAIAKKEGGSVASVIRRAIQTNVMRVHPELMIRMLESEVETFLDHIRERFPHSKLKGTRRPAIKRGILKLLV